MITSCKDLTIAAFRICMYGNDLSPLGEGSTEELDAAWLAIRSEWYSLTKAPGIQAMLSQSSEVIALESRIERIESLIVVCKMFADERLAELLRADGFQLDIPDSDDESNYMQQINVISAKLAPLKMRLAGLLKELPTQKTQKEEAQTIEQSEDSFESLLIDAWQFMGAKIDEESTTIYTLCKIINKMSDQIKRHNSAIKNRALQHS